MAGRDIEAFVRDLRAFDARAEVVKQLRTEIRKPIPQVRTAIRRHARAILPAAGGLGAWAAKTSVTASVKVTARTVGIRLRGKRKSLRGPSDVGALNRGRVKHPLWGYRPASIDAWPLQLVPKGFFTTPAGEVDQWADAALSAVDRAIATVAGGGGGGRP